jgi:hypothetical protein
VSDDGTCGEPDDESHLIGESGGESCLIYGLMEVQIL